MPNTRLSRGRYSTKFRTLPYLALLYFSRGVFFICIDLYFVWCMGWPERQKILLTWQVTGRVIHVYYVIYGESFLLSTLLLSQHHTSFWTSCFRLKSCHNMPFSEAGTSTFSKKASFNRSLVIQVVQLDTYYFAWFAFSCFPVKYSYATLATASPRATPTPPFCFARWHRLYLIVLSLHG